MTIQVGSTIPTITLRHMTADGMADISTDSVFAGKKIVLFAVPGAFTPTCSIKHVPSFLDHLDEFVAKGVDQVVCLAVNDPFIMKHWAESTGAAGKIQFLPDGNGELTKALGLEMDGSGYGMGLRSQRYAMVVDDGVVTYLAIEKPGAFDVSSGEAVLKHL